MGEQVLELLKALYGPGQDETVLRTLCGNACGMLDCRLKDGLAPEDCGEAYLLAAVWLVMDWLRDSQGWSDITSLSAGDLTVRREGGGDSGKLSRQALGLMAPFLRDDGFVFRGVKG